MSTLYCAAAKQHKAGIVQYNFGLLLTSVNLYSTCRIYIYKNARNKRCKSYVARSKSSKQRKKEFILYLCTCAKEWKYIKSIWIVVVFDNNQLNVIELCASLHLVYNFIFIYIFCECRVCRCMRLMLASEFLCHLQNI